MLTDEQIELRKSGIGGSEIAALLGLDPYRTAHDLYLEKTGRGPERQDSEPAFWGRILEEPIAQVYAQRTGVTLRPSTTLVHPSRPWQLATPDRLVFQKPELHVPDWGLEAKNKGFRQAPHWGAEGTDLVPEAVALQCHWGMSVTDLPRWDVAMLLNGNQLRIYTLYRDPAIEAGLLEVAENFWRRHVQADTPPPVDGSEGCDRMLRALFPRERRPLAPAPIEAEHWVLGRKALLEQRKQIDEQIAEHEALLKLAIGDQEGVEGPWGRATWKTATGTIDWKAAADALGAGSDFAEQFRRAGARRLHVSFAKERNANG
jgi:putative phage-type endonuclease